MDALREVITFNIEFSKLDKFQKQKKNLQKNKIIIIAKIIIQIIIINLFTKRNPISVNKENLIIIQIQITIIIITTIAT